MISHRAARLAIRAKIAMLVAATTGVTALSATAAGFHRVAGSFLTDGFAVGMWVTPSGFANNVSGVVTGVTATDLFVTLYVITYVAGTQNVASPAMIVEGAAGGRSIVAGLPFMCEWENVAFRKIAGVPYVNETYLPGPSKKVSFGGTGVMEWLPLYKPKIYVPTGTGAGAGDAYADALLILFAPTTVVPTSAAMSIVVRSDIAPSSGQLLPSSDPGFSFTPVEIPLQLRTLNTV